MSQRDSDATSGLVNDAANELPRVIPATERLEGRTPHQVVEAILVIALQDHPDVVPARVVSVSQTGEALTMAAVDVQPTPDPRDTEEPISRDREAESVDSGQTRLVDLVRAAGKGDRLAWEELQERFSGLLWGIPLAYQLSRADAANVVQATWLRLIQHLGRIRNPELLDVWLATTARRECLRVLRHPEPAQQIGQPSNPPAWEAVHTDPEVGTFIDSAQAVTGATLPDNKADADAHGNREPHPRPAPGWARLTPTEVEVVRLLIEGRTNHEISKSLYISHRAVEAKLSRLFAKLGFADTLGISFSERPTDSTLQSH